MYEQWGRKDDYHPAEDSANSGRGAPDEFLVEVQARSLNEKVGEHRAEITFSRKKPVRKIHHGFMEKSGKKKARDDLPLMLSVKGFSHVRNPILDPEIPAKKAPGDLTLNLNLFLNICLH